MKLFSRQSFIVTVLCLRPGTALAALGFDNVWGPYIPADLTFSASDVSSTKTDCVISSNDGDNARRDYFVTASQDATGNFELTNSSSDSLRIRLRYSDDNNPAAKAMSDGVELGTSFTGNTTARCSGAAVNASLRVEVLLADYEVNSVSAGNYTGTVTITMRRGGQTRTSTVNLSIDVSGLVRITDLDDFNFDMTGWTSGNLTKIRLHPAD